MVAEARLELATFGL